LIVYISFKQIVAIADKCAHIINTPFGRQVSIDQGRFYREMDMLVSKLGIGGNYIVKVNKRDNCWIITGEDLYKI